MYQVKRPSRSEFVPVRNLTYHVRVWGEPVAGRPPLVLTHGWMDVGASWQFVVDALSQDRHVIAPDWRGYGLTAWQPGSGNVDAYWFPDYLADLDVLLDHYAGAETVNLVGHSMGGNVVMHYAGIRPERIRRLVNLEGFGMPRKLPADAPARYAQWIDEVKSFHRGEKALTGYEALAGVARRLMRTNPRLDRDKAEWLAGHWAQQDASGRWNVMGDAAHKVVGANIHRVDEMLALYAAITAPVLSAVATGEDSLSKWWKGGYSLAEFKERMKHVRDVVHADVPDAGHMLHHDQPAILAQLVEDFIA